MVNPTLTRQFHSENAFRLMENPMSDTAAPARALRNSAANLMGSSASANALRAIRLGLADQKSLKVAPLLEKAVREIRAHRPESAAELALEALQIDERSGLGWHVLAIAQEGRGDFVNSLSCYEAAVALLPGDQEILINLARLAFRMGMPETAEGLLRHVLAMTPDHAEGVNNLALAVQAQERTAEAIEILRTFLASSPGHANIWNSLGTLVADQGDPENAEIFYREALRLDPKLARARYNLGNLWLTLGRAEDALREVENALRFPLAADEKAMMILTRGLSQLTLGRIGTGWRDYEARNDSHFPDGTQFALEAPRWKPGQSLAGKSLMIVGEQGLGDEVAFSSIVPDVMDQLGDEGRLFLAVEHRLVALLARSFPKADVMAHKTVKVAGRTIRVVPELEHIGGVDLWTPLASLFQDVRPSIDSFPQRVGFITPDPDRVAHWREALSRLPAGPRVGLLWKSAVLAAGRHRFFSTFEAWEPVLRTPGVVFVNLQYGDCTEELQLARERFGVEIWNPPGIDLKQDLDDVTALSMALDLVIGFSNATFNLAAAAGAPAWLISARGAWTALGTDRYPWYPQVRLYRPDAFAAWEPVLQSVAKDLSGMLRPDPE